MPDFVMSNHAIDVLIERDIPEQWVWDTITEPENIWKGPDNNTHYTRRFPERGDRVLHVVVNENINPQRVVTAFFDRRLKKAGAREPDET